MRALVQRVRSASVEVEGRVVGAIGHGLLVFLGVAPDDGPDEVRYIASKIHGLRVFDDDAGRMNRSIGDVAGAVLLVSQFTLYADTRRGRRPSFDGAAAPAHAQSEYAAVADALRALGVSVETGIFQAHMLVALVNDGPVTLMLESDRRN
ncbi:MAG: D-aminoacyl-tRNA deacylase [Vicinamibacterales bacterium]